MTKTNNLYEDIKLRTNGDIYIGVVGPVRCGKSTFIQRFMNNFVLPNMAAGAEKVRATDELPQSGDGKMVMTTQPKFVPSRAVPINVGAISLNVRMVDCVGFMIDGAMSGESSQDRMLQTPWAAEKIPFSKAAAIGTEKVINEHSTIAVMVTSDGSFGEIERAKYVPGEEQAIEALRQTGKPYVIVLNSEKVEDANTQKLVAEMKSKYDAPVIAINIQQLNTKDIEMIFASIITQFPVNSIDIFTPTWMRALDAKNPIMQEMLEEVMSATNNCNKIGEYKNEYMLYNDSERFEPILCNNIDMANGSLEFNILPKEDLFYKVLSETSGIDISSDYALLDYVAGLAESKSKYDKIKDALEQVEAFGYGIVSPSDSEIILDEPDFLTKGTKSAIRLKASASTLHIMKVDVSSEVLPMMGNEKQSQDMVDYLSKAYEEDPHNMWQTNMFGRTLENMVTDELTSKIHNMPTGAQLKMRKTVSRIVNEGRGGVICILL